MSSAEEIPSGNGEPAQGLFEYVTSQLSSVYRDHSPSTRFKIVGSVRHLWEYLGRPPFPDDLTEKNLRGLADHLLNYGKAQTTVNTVLKQLHGIGVLAAAAGMLEKK